MLLLLGRAGGHMVMNTPVPYNLDIEPLLQVDPISGGLFPYPCHNQYGFTARTPVEAGGMTLVNFTGGGQHGGGSCQFSITYDEPVNGGDWNKSAAFKTIYSIIGGCPAVFTDESRNLAPAAMDQHKREDSKHCGNDTGIDCIRQFMIPVPKFLKNGPATFAWTWFNKLGNKEMYMNCAPITITGGSGDEEQIKALPDIFVANYHNDPEVPNCVTGTRADKVVLNFPNPGKYGRVLQDPVEPATKPQGYCSQIPPARSTPTFEEESTPQATPALSTGGNSTITTSTPTSSTTSTLTSSTTTITTTSDSEPVIRPTTNIPLLPTPSNTTLPRLNATATTPPSIILPTNRTTTISTSTSTNLSPHPPMGPRPTINKPSAQAVPCPTDGELVCLDASTFGLCNWGWAVPQAVAAGTECHEGKIVKRRRALWI